MRKFVLIVFVMVLFAPGTADAKKKNRAKTFENLPYSLTEMAAKNDSIIHEGYSLYLKEKLAWTAEDMFFAECNRKEIVQGSLISGIFPDFSCIFYNLKTRQCIFEVKMNVEKGEAFGIDSIRVLTDMELDKINLQSRLYNAVYSLDVEINEPPKGCSFNFDWIRIDENLFRVFVIMGCETPHVIPWGNDLSYDCDSLGNVLNVRKYHHSSIIIPTAHNGEKVRQVFHSHTDLHPLISSTDIAIFLLYGEELEGFRVLNNGIYYYYDKKSNSISIITP